jgi:hypothetical protein
MATQIVEEETGKYPPENSIRYPGWGLGLAAFVGVMAHFMV